MENLIERSGTSKTEIITVATRGQEAMANYIERSGTAKTGRNTEATRKRGTTEIEGSSGTPKFKDRRAEEVDGAPPIFSMNWQGSFTLHSASGGTFQLHNSDVMLRVPSGAVPTEKVHIKAAVCTDIDYIHSKLQLAHDEEIVSPLIEYKTEESIQFQKPVTIILPHLLPDTYDLDMISVYHVHLKEDGTLEKRRLTFPTNLPEDDNTTWDKQPYCQMSGDWTLIKTCSFSGFFLCQNCQQDAKTRPILYAAVNGRFETEDKVSVQINIWDKRLNIQDFKKDVGIDLEQKKLQSIQLLNGIEGTQLHVSLRMQQSVALAEDENGDPLTPIEKIFDMPDALVCGECWRKGEFNVLQKEWILLTNGTPVNDVTLAIQVNHCLTPQADQQEPGDNSRPISTDIPCVIQRVTSRDAFLPIISQKLEEMDSGQREIVAERMTITVQQLDRLIRTNDLTSLDQQRLLRAVFTILSSSNQLSICVD